MRSKITLAVLVLAAMVAGCETVTSTDRGKGVYEISSSVERVSAQPGHAGAYIQLKAMAKKNCPSGWAVLNEETDIRQGKEYILQTIQCKTAKSG